jgi:NADPH2:quinone reductase
MTLMNVTDPELAVIHADLVKGLETQTLRPIVNVEMPLIDAPKTHEKVMEAGAHGKIVLVP